MSKQFKITQSWIKDIRDYFSGNQCGNLIKYKWIDGNLIEGTKAMKLGQYVEQLVLGSLPKDGKPVIPETQKNGTPYADWLKAYKHSMNAKDVIANMGIKILSAGKKITKGRHEGTLDAICEATKDIELKDGSYIKDGTKFILDLKYSGLIEDKWERMGWYLTEDQIAYHAIQATEYHFLTDLPFFYFVIGANGTLETTTTDIKFFEFVISQRSLDDHLTMANDLLEKFEYEKITGFEIRAEYNRCQKCPIKDKCTDKVTVPQAEVITV